MIVVAGGTGTLGQRLVERGLSARVFTRDASRAQDLARSEFEVFVSDVRDRDRVAEAVQNAPAVISAIHGFIGTGGVTPSLHLHRRQRAGPHLRRARPEHGHCCMAWANYPGRSEPRSAAR